MRLSGYSYVTGRSEGISDFQDVHVTTTAEGYNQIEVARDAHDTTPKIYAVERRLLPTGSWIRLLTAHAFDTEADPELIAETKATVTFEPFDNDWNITPTPTWGLPRTMESPWFSPIEMVGNELLLPEDVLWVSGDAPINTWNNGVYKNGKYTVSINSGYVSVGLTSNNSTIADIYIDTSNYFTTDGIASGAIMDGGWIYIEPAKPPLIYGNFQLKTPPEYIRPGLYKIDNTYLITTKSINGTSGSGIISVLSDPYPERWIPRMMGRSFIELTSPAFVPPFFESEPERVGVEVVEVPNDFPNIKPEIVTPYANETGVFNAWDLPDGVIYAPAERPYDLFIPFDATKEEWGGFYLNSLEDYRPAVDIRGNEEAAFPNEHGYTLYNIPPIPRGSLYVEWKGSTSFRIIQNDDLTVTFRKGYLYFRSQSAPNSNGIKNIQPVSNDWNKTKIEWGDGNHLLINEEPGITTKLSWDKVTHTTKGKRLTWGQMTVNPSTTRIINPDMPIIDGYQFQDTIINWVTDAPEVPGNTPPNIRFDYKPRTWGRILFEQFDPDMIDLRASDNVDHLGAYYDAPLGDFH